MTIIVTETAGGKTTEDITEITHMGAIALICCAMLKVMRLMDCGEAGITYSKREVPRPEEDKIS